jgi:hypothetical protein
MRLGRLQAVATLHLLVTSVIILVRGEQQVRFLSSRRDITWSSRIKDVAESTENLSGSSDAARIIQRRLKNAASSRRRRRVPDAFYAATGGKSIKSKAKKGSSKTEAKGPKGSSKTKAKGPKGGKKIKGLKGGSKGKGGKGSSKALSGKDWGKAKGKRSSKSSKGGAASGCSETIFYYNNQEFKNAFNGDGSIATNGKVPLYNEDGETIGLYTESTVVVGEKNCNSNGVYSFEFKNGVPKSQIFTAQTCCGVEMQAVTGGTGIFQCTTGFVEQLVLDTKPNRTYRRIVVCESASGMCSA